LVRQFHVRVLAPLFCLAAAWMAAGAAFGADSPSAANLFAQGQRAEKAGHMAEAYLLYSEAAAKDPKNENYWARSQAVRPQASLEMAPRTLPTPEHPEGEMPPPLHFDSVTARDLADARKPLPPTELAAQPGTKDFNLRANPQTLFQTVAKAFGLDCVFDGDYPPGNNIHFEITGVDYRVALHALELATASFLIPVTPKLFLVAKDTPQKRSELEPIVAVEAHLGAPTNTQDFTALITAVQQSMAIEKVSWDAQTNTVVMRDRISKVLPARAMLEQLSHARPQVMLETDILEVDRSKMLEWGISLPNVFNIVPFSSLGQGIATLAELAQWGPEGTLFAISIASASLAAQFSNTDSVSLSHVDLRSIDGQAATFHMGERYPVLTSGYFGSSSTTTPTTTTPTTTTGTTSTSSSSTLQNPNLFGSATNPTGVVTADFNGDGIPDFAAADAGSNTVSVFLGTGGGNFANPVTYTVGQNPSAIIAVQTTGDGYLDLITADATSNDVSVLLGNGDGTFKPYKTYPAGTQPAALVSANFNSDGYVDLAVANAGSNNISILMGNGDGTFQQPVNIAVGTSPRAIASADFNADGYADLAVADYTSNDLWIFLGNGNGTFTHNNTYTGLNAPRGITAQILNLNESTTMDLIVANSGGNTVSVFLGDGAGNFPTVTQYATGSGPVAVVTADFTLNNINDIATANSGDGTISLLLGNGDGTFQSAIEITIGTGTEPDALVAGSFNSNGYPGLMVANFATDDFSVLFGSGNGSFYNPSGTSYSYNGGTSYAPPPAFQYEDLGLALKMTPHIHGMNQVGLEVEAEIELLTGNSTDGIPEIAQRKVVSQVDLRTGEAAIVAGLLSTDEARSIVGIPGLSSLPGLGPLLRTNTKNTDSQEIIIMIRPVLIDLPPDQFVSRSFWIGSEARPLTPL
jgi:Flp pilus assembly secretin CpaC